MNHHKIGETNEPSMYRISDNAVSYSGESYDMLSFCVFLHSETNSCLGCLFTFSDVHLLSMVRPDILLCMNHQSYSLEIHEWNGKEWQPYQADDVQLQFYMMSPYVLKTLSHDGKVLPIYLAS